MIYSSTERVHIKAKDYVSVFRLATQPSPKMQVIRERLSLWKQQRVFEASPIVSVDKKAPLLAEIRRKREHLQGTTFEDRFASMSFVPKLSFEQLSELWEGDIADSKDD